MSITISNSKDKSGIGWLMLKVFVLFFYIYEFNLFTFGLPTFLTSRRVVVVGLFAILALYNFVLHKKYQTLGMWTKSTRTCRAYRTFCILQLCLLIFTYIQIIGLGRGVGDHIFDSITRLLMFGIFPVWLFYQIFNSFEEFMKVILIVTIIQAIIILVSTINPNVAFVIDTLFGMDSEYIQTHRGGYAGGLACITAPGCLRFSMGLIACLYFMMKRMNLWWTILYFALSVVASMVARTGLFISISGLLIALAYTIRLHSWKGLGRYVASLAVIGVSLFLFLRSDFTENVFDFNRMEELLFEDGGAEFVESYTDGDDTIVPPLNADTIYGIGMISGTSLQGYRVNVDGGFARIYAAIGLPLAILFYLLFFSCISKITLAIPSNKLVERYTMLFFIAVILIGELKEYTIYQQYMVCIFFTSAFLIERSGVVGRTSSPIPRSYGNN